MGKTLMNMPYDGCKLFPPHNGYAAHVSFYYGVKPGESHLLLLGARFGVVYSPSVFSTTKSHWCYTVFEVRLCRFRDGAPKERGYAQVSERMLTPEEIYHFGREWKRLIDQTAATDAA